MRTQRRVWAAFSAGALIAAIVVGGVSVAQTEGGDEITACESPSGFLRKVDSVDQCRGDETPVTWNQTGPPGPPGQAALGPTYSAGAPWASFDPGDPEVDFMRLDLPPGNYMFYVTLDAYPERLFTPEGDPAGFGMGGYVNCRFFEEAADGTRVFRSFGPTAVAAGYSPLTTPPGFDGPGLPYLPGESTYIRAYPFHPEGAAVVAVCEHGWGERLDVSGQWTAVASGEFNDQRSP